MSMPALGLRTRIVISLALVMILFIALTEISVSQLVKVSLSRQATAVEANGGTPPDARVHALDVAKELSRLRKMVLFYMVTGAVLALLLGSLAITRSVVRPLSSITEAVERVADGDLKAQVPIRGSGELIQLGISFNRMTNTLKKQRESLHTQLQEIAKSSTDLGQAQDQLVRAAKLASVGTLAAGVAHEIGNPIAGILGLLDALEGETDEKTAASYRGLVRKEVTRIDGIIAELLAFARPVVIKEDGPVKTQLAEVVEHVQSLMSAQRLFDKIDVTVDLEADACVTISRDDLTQLLVNLLLNAGQAMEGRGKLTIRSTTVEEWRPPMAVVARRAVKLTVTDDGPGIDREIAAKIFDPFFTQSKSKTGEGSGLGLAICQSICNRAGGEISLETDYTNGARFELMFPAG